jgi:lipopolysaccharide/colanic/teichoic acid biosynthesis glycosyltransferase
VILSEDRWRRALDVGLAGTILIVTLPLSAAAAVLVRLGSPGPVLHRSVRAGRHGQPFVLYKLRTMVDDASAIGQGITAGRDPRVTPVGRVLRATKVDELPQLVNVLRGEMSLVGPRPEDPRYVAMYNDEQRQVLAALPGITSPASVIYRHEHALLGRAHDGQDYYVNVLMPRKIEVDLAYLERRTIRSDLRVLLQTAVALTRRSGSSCRDL